uniref:LYPD6B_0 protein n=1 Tax=Fopius arisanus TaxID=64838 RepID=A0A0C9PRQ8_9HYME
MITWVMVGLLLAAETTCGKNLVSENEVGRDELKTKQNGVKRPDEEDTYRLTCYTCVNVSDNQICISCCDMSYCNVDSPTNSTNAIYTRKRRGKSKGKRKKPGRNDSGADIRRTSNLSLTTLVASLLYAYHC